MNSETVKKDDGGPAFPDPGRAQSVKQRGLLPATGMTLRDYYAGKAPIDLDQAARMFNDENGRKASLLEALQQFAFLSFAYADAMLAERAK